MKASSGAPVVLARIESFWQTMAHTSVTCWMEGAPARADPADAATMRRRTAVRPERERRDSLFPAGVAMATPVKRGLKGR